MYFLIQPPSVMEDEGRFFLAGGPYPTYDAADSARIKKAADSEGWFKPGSFMIFHEATTTVSKKGTKNG